MASRKRKGPRAGLPPLHRSGDLWFGAVLGFIVGLMVALHLLAP